MSAESIVNTLISNALTIAQRSPRLRRASPRTPRNAIDEAMFELEGAPVFGGGPTAPVLGQADNRRWQHALQIGIRLQGWRINCQFAGIFNGFLNDYFPPLGFCLSSVETWICNTINNGGTGIPAAVEAQIWQRGRDKEALEAARLEDEALNFFCRAGL